MDELEQAESVIVDQQELIDALVAALEAIVKETSETSIAHSNIGSDCVKCRLVNLENTALAALKLAREGQS